MKLSRPGRREPPAGDCSEPPAGARLVLSPRERRERNTLRFVMKLPTRLILRALRQPPIEIDGQILDSQMQLNLVLSKLARKPGLTDLPDAHARRSLAHDAQVHALEVHGVQTRDLSIPADDAHKIGARHYQRETGASSSGALIVFFHGGGYVLGDVEMYDSVCRFICQETEAAVLSVDYRLAPEHGFPQGLEDATAAYLWAVNHAQELGAEPKRVAVAGDSAGANFAAVISQICVERGAPAPSWQILIYPTCDAAGSYPSTKLFAEDFLLTEKDMDVFEAKYLQKSCEAGHAIDENDARISPLRAKSLRGLAPAIVLTAGFDPLRDEGEAYAQRLKDAGVDATLICERTMIHGFINMIGFSSSAREKFRSLLKLVKGRL